MGLIRKLKEKFRKKRKEVKEEIKVAVKEELTEVKKDLKSYFYHNKDGIVNFKDLTSYLRDEFKDFLDEDDNGEIEVSEVKHRIEQVYEFAKR